MIGMVDQVEEKQSLEIAGFYQEWCYARFECFSSDAFLQKVMQPTALRRQASLLVPYSEINSSN